MESGKSSVILDCARAFPCHRHSCKARVFAFSLREYCGRDFHRKKKRPVSRLGSWGIAPDVCRALTETLKNRDRSLASKQSRGSRLSTGVELKDRFNWHLDGKYVAGKHWHGITGTGYPDFCVAMSRPQARMRVYASTRSRAQLWVANSLIASITVSSTGTVSGVRRPSS